MDIKEQTIRLIDELKATCANYGMGNDGNEYKIITQVFLYKFLNDKFGYEIKNARSEIAKKIKEADKWEVAYAELSDNERMLLQSSLSADVPILEPYHLISNLWNQQSKGDFDTIFDNTMTDIAEKNADIFSTQTTDNTKIPLFETLTNFVTDTAHRADFARALVDKLVNFSFEGAFEKHYDFFASIFEYLIKDYNTAGGGKYAEYYTPHAIATIMARLLVGDETDLHSQECYDPSAGTGTLLMALSHQIGEDRCTIFSQDISQRSNKMLKLNLLLNGLVSSLDYAIQGDTLVAPYHKSDDGQSLRQFDFVVSNPPFKMDFSGTLEKIAAQPARFWAGVPNIPAKKKESMAIYTCFIQHVINSLKDTGKGAIVIPTGFITAKSGIEKKILKRIVDERLVYGCVSMPSNVFANTGTNVSVLFFDKSASADKVVLIDASKLGEEYKEGNNQKKRLRDFEVEQIVTTFRESKSVDDFSVCVSYDEIKEKGYSLSAGQYFDIKIEYVDITEEEFNARMSSFRQTLTEQFAESHRLENEIMRQLDNLIFNENVRLE
ncbi:class I SAM-dependent DNA methyltransferase [Alloprevotella tannerae]|uniref:HsdM family class I SAM-dependent methyltransferase n=1 Tax=Alloprevotella tannerae TaxID=76122 RepID=UPI0025EFB624|nr:class I SAM-dependent DNA methyltransferase [Alloprevotella tannerae]